jgi:hypothetical protein
MFTSISDIFSLILRSSYLRESLFICVLLIPGVDDMHITYFLSKSSTYPPYLLKTNLKLFKALFVGVYCMELSLVDIVY